MSKLIDMMYQTNPKRKMSPLLRVIYLLLGVGAAAFLRQSAAASDRHHGLSGSHVCNQRRVRCPHQWASHLSGGKLPTRFRHPIDMGFSSDHLDR